MMRCLGFRDEEEEGSSMEFDELSRKVIGCAIEVHRTLGPGLLESTYEHCLAHEPKLHGLDFKLQWPITVEYKGIRLDHGYKIDMIVEDSLIVELKCVDQVLGVHEARLLTYMKLSGIRTGLLLNFYVRRLKDGIKRFTL